MTKNTTDEKLKKERCIGICKETGKSVLMDFDEKQEYWLCLHRDNRKEELKDIADFLKKYK